MHCRVHCGWAGTAREASVLREAISGGDSLQHSGLSPSSGGQAIMTALVSQDHADIFLK